MLGLGGIGLKLMLAGIAASVALGAFGIFVANIKAGERARINAELSEQRREMAAARHKAIKESERRLYESRQREARSRLEFEEWRSAQTDDGCVFSPDTIRQLQSYGYSSDS